MIRSMTAFGNARSDTEHGSLTIEFRTVNSRFLDINFRLPEDLRMAEGAVREELGRFVKRGKVDIRVNYSRAEASLSKALDPERLAIMSEQLRQARQAIPDVPAPTLADLLNGSGPGDATAFDTEAWMAMCVDAARQALSELQSAREREGARLAEMMLACSRDMSTIVDQVERELPSVLAEHQERVTQKLRDALQAVSPDGYAHISGAELSARIAQEASLFGLRIDVAEELSRLRSHIAELGHLLGGDQAETAAAKKSGGGSAGKRLDFLCQEMNREANTLGSKAGALNVTRAAIDLKLLIEQLREQAQNIE
ncbi:YicC/YloC family endoribonuclease [Parapusillimonas sp. JC17]|uniref:YicC/YloC family endoribonuclease n=1 Tax=Parapusillimonas sp. JC17 TaxID=3445768 RepID=UPI003FA0978D